ncbi:hybrid sensor histidine kinase/response regulator [Niabella ginsenosidivorans]|uniref:histidine kinase n=1 Tax=Niabella ginsenosidivorans TaxID=1176587 RepID=A0A1A9IAK9_9BACT|nr:two-component regulator propeller domain-containing protein [Niabella ginsenosidivorans]ANH83790.1 hybrid sensor histidine kinase/response regulator [Niabella ginsenosidivorans]
MAVSAAAQPPEFNHLTVENGLSNNSVLSIVQDSRGFIWLGTSAGLNRYDGSKIKVYTPDSNSSQSLWSAGILSLLRDSKSAIWIGTNTGLNRYDEQKDNFERIRLPAIGTAAINCLYEDHQGTLWIGSSKGIFAFLTNGTKRQRLQFTTPRGAPVTTGVVRTIFEDHQGNLWIGTSNGLIRMWKERQQYFSENFFYDPSRPESLSSNNISVIYEDPQNHLWIGTQNSGLNLYRPANKTFRRFMAGNGNRGPIHNNIRSLVARNNNELWIGTQEGLSVMDINNGVLTSYQNEGDNVKSLSQNSIYSLYKDSNGSMWVGTYFGGVNRVDAFSTGFKVIRNNGSSNTLANNVVSTILEDNNNNLWMGTEGAGLIFYNRKNQKYQVFKNEISDPFSIASNLVKVAYIDKDGNIWCGTHGGGLNVLNKATGKFLHYLYLPGDAENANLEILTLTEGGEGLFWVGTSRGLRVFQRKGLQLNELPLKQINNKLSGFIASTLYTDRKGQVWIGTSSGLHVIKHYVLKTISTTLSVNTIFEDRKGMIWIGLRTGGIASWNPVSSQLTRYNHPGAPSANILGILEDPNGWLWLSSDEGLFRYNPVSKTTLSYSVSDGLAGGEFNYNSHLKDHNGFFYFGGYHGITYFLPADIEVNPYKAPLVFTNLWLGNRQVQINAPDGLLKKNISHSDQLTFRPNQNLFTINFALLNFIKSDKNRYAYKLSGFDRDWKQVHNPAATYTNLPPGDYQFFVKGANNDGIWTEPIMVKIKVLPPVWRTWWAYAIYTFLLAGVLFLVIRFFFLRALFKKEEELHQVKLNFFTNVSHELRTHLSLIMAPVEKLIDINHKDPFTSQQLMQIKNNSNRLLKLVSELMDFRKAESNHLDLRVSKQDLISFLQDIYTSFRELSLAKNIRIAFTHNSNQVFLYFDEEQLEKVFFNLLANAFKFTPEGGHISVTVNTQPGFTEIIVSDSGRGIAAKYLGKLFTNYYQVADHGMQNTGYGLGLALSRKITELHHGSIRVESTPATATTEGRTSFFVRLLPGKKHFEGNAHVTILPGRKPFPPATRQSIPIREKPAPVAPAGIRIKRQTILIAEDNPELRALIKQQLEPYYLVHESADGADAWENAKEHLPDLIISDIMMPGMDGIMLCNRLKTDQRTCHIPVLLLTAKSTQHDQVKGLENGADIYLTKPFSTKILELHVNNLLQAHKRLQEKNMRELRFFAASTQSVSTEDPQHKMDSDFLAAVTTIIDEHLEDPGFVVEQLSRKVAMSPPVLYKKIRALTNLSVNEFIKTRRFKKAAALLLQKGLTINEISYAVGYEDRKYFSKEFKKYFGVAPSDFNQHILEQHKQMLNTNEII